jgi:hypothetical protein
VIFPRPGGSRCYTTIFSPVTEDGRVDVATRTYISTNNTIMDRTVE